MSAILPAGVWQMTCELRRFNNSYKLNGTDTRLQQKWVRGDGEVHWIDVPLVWEPEPAPPPPSAPAAKE